MKFIVHFEQLKERCYLIKERCGLECINTHTKISSIVIHYSTYLVIQNKVKLRHTETQTPLTHRVTCPCTHACTHPQTHTHMFTGFHARAHTHTYMHTNGWIAHACAAHGMAWMVYIKCPQPHPILPVHPEFKKTTTMASQALELLSHSTD